MSSCPVKFTCPTIDRAIAGLEQALSSIDQAYVEIEEFLGTHGVLEELRSANDALREWGIDLETENEELKAEIEILQRELNDLTET